MTDPTALRVYRRYMTAAVIGDPKELLRHFKEKVVGRVCKQETVAKKDLPLLQRAVEAAARQDVETVNALREELAGTTRERTEIRNLMFGHWYPYEQPESAQLCYAILQQYDLPAPIRKGIETTAKFWSRTRIGKPKSNAGSDTFEYMAVQLDAYLRLCAELHKQEGVFESALAKGKRDDDPGASTSRKLDAGPFKVVNVGGYDDETMHNIVEVVQAAARAMESIGLGKVCYGDVLVSKSIENRRNVLAFYLYKHDEMFVRADVMKTFDTVRTVCHELTHRLVEKFIPTKRREIERLYQAMKRNDASLLENLPQPDLGEIVREKGKEFKVTGISAWDDKIKLAPVDDAPAAEGPKVYYTTSLVGYHRMKGTKIDTPFVTAYAKTDPEENFCEMVGFYALGKLPEALRGPLEAILTG